MPLTIDPVLQSLIPALTAEEAALLEDNLLADGCLTPLIVWQETQQLLDGFCRKVRFWGQNPKIGCQEFNDLQTHKLTKK